jgi:hypothetical protein
MGVTDGSREEGNRERRHQDVHHGSAPMHRISGSAINALFCFIFGWRSATRRIGFREGRYGEDIGIS